MKLIYLICLLVSCSLNKNFNFETKMPKRGLEPLNFEEVKDEADDFDGMISPTTEKFKEMIRRNDTKKLSRQFSTGEGKEEFDQWLATYNGTGSHINCNKNTQRILEKNSDLGKYTLSPLERCSVYHSAEFDEEDIDEYEENIVVKQTKFNKLFVHKNFECDPKNFECDPNSIDIKDEIKKFNNGEDTGEHNMVNCLFRNIPVKNQRVYYHKIGEDMMLDGYSDFKNQDDEEKYYKTVNNRIKKLNRYLEKKKNMLKRLKKNNPKGYKDYIKKEEEEKKKQNYKKYEDYTEIEGYFE